MLDFLFFTTLLCRLGPVGSRERNPHLLSADKHHIISPTHTCNKKCFCQPLCKLLLCARRPCTGSNLLELPLSYSADDSPDQYFPAMKKLIRCLFMDNENSELVVVDRLILSLRLIVSGSSLVIASSTFPVLARQSRSLILRVHMDSRLETIVFVPRML